MSEIQSLIESFEAEFDEICRAMAPAELERFRSEFAALIPAVAAAQDARTARKVLSDLRLVYGRYPAVRHRVLPPPVGQAPTPASLRPSDQPIKDLTTAELAQAMQALCEKMDARLQPSFQSSPQKLPPQEDKR